MAAIRHKGCVSAEHGIGTEKINFYTRSIRKEIPFIHWN